jgi:Zn-finger nucleic acid-binding protein
MNQQPAGLICPACRVDLVMSERSGVEIDYCPKCRGVWLDRGELDKILERAAAEMPGRTASPPPASPQMDRPFGRKPDSDEYPAYGHQHGKHYKRKSFLHDLFD